MKLLRASGFPGLVVALVELALLSVVLVALLAYRSAINARAESRDAVEVGDNTLIALLDAETGERGYLITNDSAFLAPFRDSRDRIDKQMAELSYYVELNGDPRAARAYAALQPLVQAKIDVLETSVGLMSQGQVEAAREQVVIGEGKRLMDEIRAGLTIIRDLDEQLLDQRSNRVDDIGRFIAFAAITLTIVTMIVVAWLLVALRRRQEATALRAVAEAKDEFVGFVSHELRTPIALVAGNVRMLEDAGFGDGDAAITEALQEISYAADRQQDIVDTLLSLAKAGSGAQLAVEPIMLTRIAQGVRRRQLRQHPGIKLEVRAGPDTPPALGDRSAVEQVLINLISNANKYGDMTKPIVIDVVEDGPGIRVSVTNAGSELDHDAFRHVFEPFFRMPASAASAPGIGLGLTVCHRLIAAQGGQMSAEAVEGGGARFTFRLPAASASDEIDV